jgi:hypothetical protein
MGILQAGNILASEIINPAYVTGGTMAATVYQILQQPTISNVINSSPANINLLTDIAGCVDTPAELLNKKVIDVINQIGMLSNSKWRIDSNSNFIFEPIANSGTSSWDIDGPNDIVSLDELGFNVLQFNSVTWDDGVYDIVNVQMNYATRRQYSYDIFDKKFDIKWIVNQTNRLILMDAFLTQNQFHHHQLTFTCKANPEIRFNQLITINLPQQTANIVNAFIWGSSSWGDGSVWGQSIYGFKISPNILWRVLTVSRKLNLSPDMQITCVQAGVGTDAGL